MEEDRDRNYGKRNCDNDISIDIHNVGSVVGGVKCIYIIYIR